MTQQRYSKFPNAGTENNNIPNPHMDAKNTMIGGVHTAAH